MAKKIEVIIAGDASSLERALRSSQKSLGSWVKSGAAFGVGLEVVRGGMRLLGDALNTGINEWQESTKVAAQTAAVLKSTGQAAHITADGVDALAESLMQLSGVDDEAIKSGENMLLTFKSIKNEVGRGNDIFNQATKAVLDMDVAMSHGNVTQENMSKTAVLVGKALNDPIGGLTALRRVGVQFTDAQEKQIKAMIKTGDVMGAQKLILKELTQEFGGSAKALGDTLPGQINKLRESFNNLTGDLVERAAPGLQRFLDFINTKLIPAEGFSAKIKVVWEGLEVVAQELKANVTETLTKMFLGYDATYVVGGEQVKVHIKPSVEIDWGPAGGFFDNLVANIKSGGGPAQDKLDAQFKELVGSGWRALQARSREESGKWAADFEPQILDPLRRLVGRVGGPAQLIAQGIQNGIRTVQAVVPFLNTVMNSIVTTITQRVPAAASAAVALGTRVVSAIAGALGPIVSRVASILGRIVGVIASAGARAISAARGIGAGIVEGILSGLGGLAGRLISSLGSQIQSGIDAVKERFHIRSPSEVTAKEIGEPLGQGVIDGWIRSSAALPSTMSESIRKAIEKARAQIESARERLGTAFDGMAARILRAFDAETSAIRTASEQRIDEISQRREMEDLLDRQAAAQQRLTEAIQEGDAAAIAAAQRDVARAQEDIDLVDLKKKAEQERIQLDSQNEERRLALEKRLEQLKAHFEREGATTKQAMAAIVKIMRSFNLDFQDAGALLGNAFANALRSAIQSAVNAASAVNVAVPGAPTGFSNGPGLGAIATDTGSTVVVNNYAPVSSERDFEDMVRSALNNVTGRQGFA